MLNLDSHMQLMNKLFVLLHSGTVCQPNQHFTLCMVFAHEKEFWNAVNKIGDS